VIKINTRNKYKQLLMELEKHIHRYLTEDINLSRLRL